MEGEQGLESELFPGVGKEPPNSVTPESSRPSAAYLPRGAIARFLTWFSVETGGSQSVVPGPVAAASPGNLLEVHILPAESYAVGRAQHHCVLTNPQGCSDALGCETRCSGP